MGNLKRVTAQWQPDWRYIAIGCTAGLIYGLLMHKLVFFPSTATAVLSTPAIILDTGIELPSKLPVVMSLPSFSKMVSEDTGDTSVADNLTSKRYGGKGWLKTRTLAPGVLEIEVKDITPEQAAKISKAVLNRAIALENDAAKRTQIGRDIQQRIIKPRVLEILQEPVVVMPMIRGGMMYSLIGFLGGGLLGYAVWTIRLSKLRLQNISC